MVRLSVKPETTGVITTPSNCGGGSLFPLLCDRALGVAPRCHLCELTLLPCHHNAGADQDGIIGSDVVIQIPAARRDLVL